MNMYECLCNNRPICEWCGEKFYSHAGLIIHSRINNGIPNCSKNPWVNKTQSDYQKGMWRSY